MVVCHAKQNVPHNVMAGGRGWWRLVGRCGEGGTRRGVKWKLGEFVGLSPPA